MGVVQPGQFEFGRGAGVEDGQFVLLLVDARSGADFDLATDLFSEFREGNL